MTPDELRSWRDRHGWSQAEAGERLGLSGRQVRRMEAGDAPIGQLHVLACEAVSAREAA